jgi:hypothetical protein
MERRETRQAAETPSASDPDPTRSSPSGLAALWADVSTTGALYTLALVHAVNPWPDDPDTRHHLISRLSTMWPACPSLRTDRWQ